MNTGMLVTTLLALMVPAAAFAQAEQKPQTDPTYEMMRRQAQMSDRQARERDHNIAYGGHLGWSKQAEVNLEKFRGELADSWRSMGMSPEGAKLVAAAYDPRLAAQSPVSVRGKNDQEVAQMMQAALKEKHYLEANQLLIDYQRRRLELSGVRTAKDGP